MRSVIDLVERQADDVGVGADELDHEGAGKALDGVAAGLAAPFAAGEIGLDLVARQALEADAGLDQPVAHGALRRDQARPVKTRCARPESRRRQVRGLLDQFGLRQDAAADADHRVGGERSSAPRVRARAAAPPRRAPPFRAPAVRRACAAASLRCGVSSISAGHERVGLDADLLRGARAGAANRRRERDFGAELRAGRTRSVAPPRPAYLKR